MSGRISSTTKIIIQFGAIKLNNWLCLYLYPFILVTAKPGKDWSKCRIHRSKLDALVANGNCIKHSAHTQRKRNTTRTVVVPFYLSDGQHNLWADAKPYTVFYSSFFWFDAWVATFYAAKRRCHSPHVEWKLFYLHPIRYSRTLLHAGACEACLLAERQSILLLGCSCSVGFQTLWVGGCVCRKVRYVDINSN